MEMHLRSIDYGHNIICRRPCPRLTLILLIFFEAAKAIELQALEVPGWVPLGARAALSCRWQLGPADVLYSVKWYKDGKEFFRHVPRDSEPCRRFPLPGVDVEDADSSGSQLVLSGATVDTGGRYRCEVSGERPLFPTVSDHKDMVVVAYPEHGPLISGVLSKYHIGDRVRANCTSGHSRPATHLSWYINGDPLPPEEYTTSYKSQNTLIVTILTLEFEVTEVHFRKNVLNVKCLATISPVYWKSLEETAILQMTTVYPQTWTITTNQKTKRADKIVANIAHINLFDHSLRFLVFLGWISIINNVTDVATC